jgi:uncharacterized membrane protein
MNERTRSIALWIVITLLLGAAIHVGVVVAIPEIIGVYLRSLAESNTLVHAPRPSADYNPVRRSGPDIVYSACPFDLSEGPLHVTALVPDSYMSVSCFARNTDNFYVKNDRQVDGAFDFVLVRPGTAASATEAGEIVQSPTTTGGIIFRYFVGDGTHEQTIEDIRRQIQIRRGKDYRGSMRRN